MTLRISVLVIFASYLGYSVVRCSVCPHDETGLNRWSDPATWDTGTIPASGSVVNVEKSVLLDVTSLTLAELNVVGSGRLIFSDDVGDITVTADGILVKDSASIVIGSDNCRFQNRVNIKLTGSRTIDRSLLDGKGEKYIVVEDQASLLIYGQDKLSWTKLNGTIDAWQNGGDDVVYSHEASPYYAIRDKYYEGPTMYIFYPCNLQPRYYRGYDFDQGGNIDGEQRVVNEMLEDLDETSNSIINCIIAVPDFGLPNGTKLSNFLNYSKCSAHSSEGVKEKQVVAIAMQRRYTTNANVSALYSKLEQMSGISRLELRDSHDYDAYALVFQLGGEAQQAFDPMKGKKGQEARASIHVNNTKVTAVSYMKTKLYSSKVDFSILRTAIGFPTISVTDDVSSWQMGDEIVLATTDYSMYHSEVRRIKDIISPSQIMLSDEVEFRHFGEIEDGVDMRAEVGLLTRNIKIEGVVSRGCPDVNENCDEFEYDTYGAHIKIFNFTAAHIEGVEFFRVGQTTDPGFYPIHFHMCQDISGKEAIIKANSFHNSFARATTIHGTWGQNETSHGVQILDNVAYDIIGHCYFLEDGAEKATILDGNLGALIKSADHNGFTTDRTGPTVFWITNPKVIMTNNVAAGAEGFGIWYVFPDEPVGTSMGLGAFAVDEARRTPLWTFDNNVVHSNGRGGMQFDNVLTSATGDVEGSLNYEPLQDPFDDKSSPVKVQITRLTSYKNWRINCWLRGGHFELMQYSSAESRRGVQLARRNRQHSYVTKSIFVGRSRGNAEGEGYPDTPRVKHYFGVVLYDGPVYIDQSWFNGFTSIPDKVAAGAIGFLPKKVFHNAFAANFTDMRFGFVDKGDGTGGNRLFDGTVDKDTFDLHGNIDSSATLRDGFGSFTQCPGAEGIQSTQVLRPEKIVYTDNCMKRENWQMVVCNDTYGKLTLGVDHGFDSSKSQMKRMNRQIPLDVAYDDDPERKAILGSDKYYYQLQFTEGFPTKVTVGARGAERGNSVVAGICLPEGTTVEDLKLYSNRPPGVSTSTDGFTRVDTLDEVFADQTMTRIFVDGRTVYLNLVSKLERDLHWDKFDWDSCPSNKCPYFVVELNTAVTDYTPCFTVSETELNDTIAQETMTSMACDLPDSEPETDWGAGDTRRTSIQANWGEWSSWSECCGDQETRRYRLCDDPIPFGTAAQCQGESEQVTDCPLECPVDGVIGLWSKWSDCYCDGIAQGSYGAKTRTRVCNLVGNGGNFCWGALSENQPCYGDCM